MDYKTNITEPHIKHLTEQKDTSIILDLSKKNGENSFSWICGENQEFKVLCQRSQSVHQIHQNLVSLSSSSPEIQQRLLQSKILFSSLQNICLSLHLLLAIPGLMLLVVVLWRLCQ